MELWILVVAFGIVALLIALTKGPPKWWRGR